MKSYKPLVILIISSNMLSKSSFSFCSLIACIELPDRPPLRLELINFLFLAVTYLSSMLVVPGYVFAAEEVVLVVVSLYTSFWFIKLV